MLAKDRKEDRGCCLQHANCNHTASRGHCCRATSCSHTFERYEEGGDKMEILPSPPPRGQSSAQTVQALKLKIEAGTPEMRRKMNKKGELRLTPLKNGVKSRGESSLSRSDLMTSRGDVMTSRGDVMTSRGDVMTSRGDVMTSRGDVMTSRGDVMTTRGDVMTSRGDAMTSRGVLMTSRDDAMTSRSLVMTSRDDAITSRSLVMTSRTVTSTATTSSPDMSLRSEGSGHSLHNQEEVSFARNGAPLRTPSIIDTTRTPITRTSGKQYTLANMPPTSDHDTEYMKEEFVSRLMKEKEELLKLRKKKEFQREKIVELRRELECRNTDEMFNTTPEPRQRLTELDRLNYIVQETPMKSDSSSNPSQSPDSGSFSPRYRLRDTDLKSDVANRILFSEANQRSTTSIVSNHDLTELPVPNSTKKRSQTDITPAKNSGFLGRRPAPSHTRSRDRLDEIPATPTRRVTVATAPPTSQITSTSEHRPSNFEPQSMMTTPIRPRTNGVINSHRNSDSEINLINNGARKSPRDFKPAKHASSMSQIDSLGTHVNHPTSASKLNLNPSEEERFNALPPELNSPYNERAVDCGPPPEDNPRKNFSLERGGAKLTPHGFDVVRTVVRTEGGEGDREVNPTLLAPFRRRSRKDKVPNSNKDKCNTQ